MPSDTKTVVLIDDQTSYSHAIGLALEITPGFELVGSAANGPNGVELCLEHEPDVVLCDYRLPNSYTGTQVVEELRAKGFDKPVVILTGYLAPQVLRETGELLNVSAMSKDTPLDGILNRLRDAVDGRSFETPDPEADPAAATGLNNTLSNGELEVLELLNTGQKPAEIADDLHLSLHTIRARIKSLHRKLDVASQGEAVAKATRLGLLVPPG